MMQYSSFVKPLLDIVIHAGDLILTYYKDDIDVTTKDDDSPVTKADLAANDYIVEKLKKLAPEIALISEEEINEAVDASQPFWLVDPLDGTKSFINKTGEFTVNIGLIHDGKPVLGIVYVPVTKTLYYTGEDGHAYKKKNGIAELISVRKKPANGLTVVASKSHRTQETDDYISKLDVHDFKASSSSLKFCLLAEGVADIYPRFGLTMEWDTAAAHAVLLAAGGYMEQPNGAAFEYGKTHITHPEIEKNYLNTYFIAWGGCKF